MGDTRFSTENIMECIKEYKKTGRYAVPASAEAEVQKLLGTLLDLELGIKHTIIDINNEILSHVDRLSCGKKMCVDKLKALLKKTLGYDG